MIYSLSRKHCSFEKQQDSYIVRDLQSRNGVFVNGIPVHERALNHGDRIEIGTSTFLFLLNEESFPEFPLVDNSLQAGSTLTLRIEDSVYLGDTPSSATKSAKVLARISKTLIGATDAVAFCEKLFDLLKEFIAYERASIIESNGEGILASRFTKKEYVQKFSQSLSEKVIREKVALLASNFALPESLSGTEIQAVICVPFSWLDQVLCLLYMDTTDPLGFKEDHLQIASAIAALTSPVLQHLRETEDLRRQNQQLNE
ncbi:FHA domain-containing protein, partial [bacterium]|nr:FHA domain-containing protein [bacterium]